MAGPGGDVIEDAVARAEDERSGQVVQLVVALIHIVA